MERGTDTHFGFDDLMDRVLKEALPVRVKPFDGLWLDIGRHEDYEAATRTFEQHRDRFLKDAPRGEAGT